jgi:hypothetical protein
MVPIILSRGLFTKETMLASLINQDRLAIIRLRLGMSDSSTGGSTPHPSRSRVSTTMEGPMRYPASRGSYRLRPWLSNHSVLSTL